MAACCWSGDYDDEPSPSCRPWMTPATRRSGGPPASAAPGATTTTSSAPSAGLSASAARGAASSSPRSAGLLGSAAPGGASTTPSSALSASLPAWAAPGASTASSPRSAAALLASTSISSRLRRRRWSSPASTFADETACAVVSITADPGIELSGIAGLHGWIQCSHSSAPFMPILAYASSNVLTDEVSVPGSVPRLKRTRARRDVMIVLRRWFHILWSMHMEGYALGGKFGPENFVIYHQSIPQLDVRLTGTIHIVRFTVGCGRLDYTQFVSSVQTMFLSQQGQGGGGAGAVPHHLRAWLDLIARGYRGEEYLLRFNSALMEPAQAFQTTMALFRSLEELEGTPLYKMVMSYCRRYRNWDCNNSLHNRYMNWARRYNLERSHRRYPFQRNVMGILKLVRDCSEHPAKGMLGLMIFIVEQDFPGLVAYFQRACSRAGLLQQLHLEATMG